MSFDESKSVLQVIILGTDALFAAHPATPIQLARACLRSGYDFVAPVSWGEELLAARIIEDVRRTAVPASIVVGCPFVAEALRTDHVVLPTTWRQVAPPVATARYVRAAFADRTLYVTYAGRCPGATAPDIDSSVLPEVLLARLLEAGCAPEEQPRYFDELVPPDRSRHASLPGGVPDPGVLFELTGARLREAAPATLSIVSLDLNSHEQIVIDLEVACGCICARDRFAAARLEPPRATAPVVRDTVAVDLTDTRQGVFVRHPSELQQQQEIPREPGADDATETAANIRTSASGAEWAGALPPGVGEAPAATAAADPHAVHMESPPRDEAAHSPTDENGHLPREAPAFDRFSAQWNGVASNAADAFPSRPGRWDGPTDHTLTGSREPWIVPGVQGPAPALLSNQSESSAVNGGDSGPTPGASDIARPDESAREDSGEAIETDT